jgi:hypothetical protein
VTLARRRAIVSKRFPSIVHLPKFVLRFFVVRPAIAAREYL